MPYHWIFQARKDICTVIHYLLTRQASGRFPCVEYILTKHNIFDALLTGHDDHNIAFQCGAIFRDCMKHESLCKASLTVRPTTLACSHSDSTLFVLSSSTTSRSFSPPQTRLPSVSPLMPLQQFERC